MSNGPTNYFILVYDMAMRHVDVREYGDDMTRANSDYAELEDRFSSLGTHEVVLVGADSLSTIKRTHSPYFTAGTAREVVDEFIASIR